MFIELNLFFFIEVIITETFIDRNLKVYICLLTSQTYQEWEGF